MGMPNARFVGFWPGASTPPRHALGRSADGRGVEAHVVQWQAHPRHDSGGECLPALPGQPFEVRRKDRGADERVHIPRIRRALHQPAPDLGEARLPQTPLRLLRPREGPGRPSDELRMGIAGDRVDDRADAIEVALASALDLEHAAWPQCPGQPRPEAPVVGTQCSVAVEMIASTDSSR